MVFLIMIGVKLITIIGFISKWTKNKIPQVLRSRRVLLDSKRSIARTIDRCYLEVPMRILKVTSLVGLTNLFSSVASAQSPLKLLKMRQRSSRDTSITQRGHQLSDDSKQTNDIVLIQCVDSKTSITALKIFWGCASTVRQTSSVEKAAFEARENWRCFATCTMFSMKHRSALLECLHKVKMGLQNSNFLCNSRQMVITLVLNPIQYRAQIHLFWLHRHDYWIRCG